MNRHRELAEMMQPVGAPPGVDPNWVHLWRMIDTVGTTAPDSISSMDLTLAGGAVIDAGGQGVDIGVNAARMETTAGQSDIDLMSGSTEQYTIFISATLRGPGSDTIYGYPFTCGYSVTEPLVGYLILRGADSGFQYYVGTSGALADLVAGELFSTTGPLDMAFVRTTDPSQSAVHAFFGGVYACGYTGQSIGNPAGDGSSPFVVGNKILALNRGMDAIYHWAGIYHSALSLPEITAIIEAGRPAARNSRSRTSPQRRGSGATR